MRFSDCSWDHCRSCERKAFTSLMRFHFTTLGICADLPANPARPSSRPLMPDGYGVPETGMRGFKNQLTADEIQALAKYVRSLDKRLDK